MGLLTKLLTRNGTQIPLLYVTFDYNKFKKEGKINSCMCNIHPVIAKDDHIKQTLFELVNYIRDTYDMDLIP